MTVESQPISLRRQTILGLVWLVLQSLLTKLVSVLGQIYLAYLLVPEHFEVISLAYSVTAFARILEMGGIREVLIHQGSGFNRLQSPAFYLSLTLGLFSAILIIMSAPVAAMIYRNPNVQYLLFGLAITPIFASLASIPTTKLQIEHRFGTLAGLSATQGVTQTVVTVIFAWMKFGAWSFVIGSVAASVIYLISSWRFALPKIAWRFSTEFWSLIWNDSLTLTLVALVTTIIQQVDYVVLGIFQPESLGFYFFAFTLATQTSQILGSNLATVFLPILCKIQSDKQHQLQVSLRAFQTLAAVGFPLAFLQAGLVAPGFHLFLPDKWIPAIPFAQVLSLGLGLNLLSSLCWNVLKSQGRFKSILYLNVIGAIGFFGSVLLAARFGSALAVAWCVDSFCAIYAPLVLWISISSIGGTWKNVASIFFVPALLSSFSLFVSWACERWIFQRDANSVLSIICISFTFCLSYLTGLILLRHPLATVWNQRTHFLFGPKSAIRR